MVFILFSLFLWEIKRKYRKVEEKKTDSHPFSHNPTLTTVNILAYLSSFFKVNVWNIVQIIYAYMVLLF